MPPSKYLDDRMSSLTHGTLRAEFLAAEAVNADATVDVRFILPHRYRFGRADLRAFAAANAGGGIKLRKWRQHPCGNKVRNLTGDSVSEDLKAIPHRNIMREILQYSIMGI